MTIVVKPLSYGQKDGTVRLDLPSNWEGPSDVVVVVDSCNTQTLLSVLLVAIREAGGRDEIDAARRLCRAILGVGS